MQWTTPSNISLSDFVRALREHPERWLLPAVVLAVVAAGYAVLRPTAWAASQALIVRDEATGSLERPGKFRHVEDMKTVQETVLELAKSQAALEAALIAVGPPEGHATEGWPSKRDVAELQGVLTISPPKGAEFGATEVFYVTLEAPSRDRAIALTSAVSHQLQVHFQKLRGTRAQSTIDELSETVALAQADLDETTAQLAGIERTVGRDLAELRILQESPSGDSHLRRTVTEMENELRQVRSTQQANQELLTLLTGAKADPASLLAAPTRLLESQPALRRLKEGLVDAQLRTAQLLGIMSESHPQVAAAKAAEQEVRHGLHGELETAIRGVEVEQRVTAGRIQSLETQLAEAHQRMNQLAAVRAPYGNIVAEARHRTEILKTAQQELAESRASLAAAAASSLISQIGTPDTGADALGPSRRTIVLCGGVGGLLLGLAFVFLTAQPVQFMPPLAPSFAAPTPSGSNGHDNLSFKQALQKLASRRMAWKK